MIFLEKTVKFFLATMWQFYSEEYIIDREKHFTRKGKLTFREYISFILYNKGRNNDIEITEFCKVFLKKKFETISSQAVGKQRMFIKPELFENLYIKFINTIYRKHKHFSDFKGYVVAACDGSIFQLPNITLTREEFNILPDDIFKKHRVQARVSGMLDVNSNLMLVTKIVEKDVKETTLAMQHLDDLKKRINIKKFIAIYDRAYKSVELMLHTEQLESKFLIRLPLNTFSKEIRAIKGNDKIISINLTNKYIRGFERENLKKIARQQGRLEIRIVEIRLPNESIQRLATNLSPEEFSIEDITELYAKRWNIETGFKKLKSQILIERFSGYRRTIIEQDFYSSIFLYNLATAIQWDAQQKMRIKKRKPDMEYIYKPCFSTIVGNMYVYLEDVLSGDYKSVSKVIDFLIEQGRKLYQQKSVLLLKQMSFFKNLLDCFLISYWGKNWERKKPKRVAKDPTNKHPGSPKVTH